MPGTPSSKAPELEELKKIRYANLKVQIRRDIYVRLATYCATKYGKVKGALSKVIEEALEEYLERHYRETVGG